MNSDVETTVDSTPEKSQVEVEGETKTEEKLSAAIATTSASPAKWGLQVNQKKALRLSIGKRNTVNPRDIAEALSAEENNNNNSNGTNGSSGNINENNTNCNANIGFVLSPRTAQKRLEVIKELIETEKLYVRDLGVIINVFLLPLKEAEFLTKLQLASIFSNIEAIYSLNQELLESFSKLPVSVDMASSNITVGKILCDKGDLLKMYAVYCSNQPCLHDTIINLKESNDQFALFLKKSFRNPDCRKLDIESFLIAPLQRLCKYPLLLKELLKHTPEEHDEFKELKEGKEKVDIIVNQVNERVRKVENVTKLIAANKTIDFSLFKFDILSDQNRRLVLDGPLKLNKKPCYCFLFSDVFLICHLNGEIREAHRVISLNFVVITNLEDTEEMKHGFELAEIGHKIIVVECESRLSKKRWCNSINSEMEKFNIAQEFKENAISNYKRLSAKIQAPIKHTKAEKKDKEKEKKAKDSERTPFSVISHIIGGKASPTPSPSPSPTATPLSPTNPRKIAVSPSTPSSTVKEVVKGPSVKVMTETFEKKSVTPPKQTPTAVQNNLGMEDRLRLELKKLSTSQKEKRILDLEMQLLEVKENYTLLKQALKTQQKKNESLQISIDRLTENSHPNNNNGGGEGKEEDWNSKVQTRFDMLNQMIDKLTEENVRLRNKLHVSRSSLHLSKQLPTLPRGQSPLSLLSPTGEILENPPSFDHPQSPSDSHIKNPNASNNNASSNKGDNNNIDHSSEKEEENEGSYKLETILEEPILCGSLKKFLTIMKGEEILAFLKAISSYQSETDPSLLVLKFKEIFRKYLSHHQYQAFNIPKKDFEHLNGVNSILQLVINQPSHKDDYHFELNPLAFKTIKSHLFECLQTQYYSKFLSHSLFSQAVNLRKKMNNFAKEEQTFGTADARFEISKDDWKTIFSNSKQITFENQSVIIKQNKQNDYLYQLQSGKLRVVQTLSGNSAANNLRVFDTEGVVFGEMSVLGKFGRATASVISDGSSIVNRLDMSFIFKMFERNPMLGQRFYINLGRKLSMLLQRLTESVSQTSTPTPTSSAEGEGQTRRRTLERNNLVFTSGLKRNLRSKLCSSTSDVPNTSSGDSKEESPPSDSATSNDKPSSDSADLKSVPKTPVDIFSIPFNPSTLPSSDASGQHGRRRLKKSGTLSNLLSRPAKLTRTASEIVDRDLQNVLKDHPNEYVIRKFNCEFGKVVKIKGDIHFYPSFICFISHIFGQKITEVIDKKFVVAWKDNYDEDSSVVFVTSTKQYKFYFGKGSSDIKLLLSSYFSFRPMNHLTDSFNTGSNADHHQNDKEDQKKKKKQRHKSLFISGNDHLKPNPISFGSDDNTELTQEMLKLTVKDWEIMLSGKEGKDNSYVLTYKKGDVIFREGQVHHMIFQISSGSCRIEKRFGGVGGPVVLNTIGAGEIFGEVSFLTEREASATVIADTDVVELIFIDAQFLKEDLLITHPHLVVRFYHCLCLTVAKRIDNLIRNFGTSESVLKPAVEKPQLPSPLSRTVRSSTFATSASSLTSDDNNDMTDDSTHRNDKLSQDTEVNDNNDNNDHDHGNEVEDEENEEANRFAESIMVDVRCGDNTEDEIEEVEDEDIEEAEEEEEVYELIDQDDDDEDDDDADEEEKGDEVYEVVEVVSDENGDDNEDA